MSQIAPPPTNIQRIRGMVTSRFLRFQQWAWKLETEGKDIFDRLVENHDQETWGSFNFPLSTP